MAGLEVLIVSRDPERFRGVAISLAHGNQRAVQTARSHETALAIATTLRPKVAIVGPDLVFLDDAFFPRILTSFSPGTRVIIANRSLPQASLVVEHCR